MLGARGEVGWAQCEPRHDTAGTLAWDDLHQDPVLAAQVSELPAAAALDTDPVPFPRRSELPPPLGRID
jgi:hypothetical protein